MATAPAWLSERRRKGASLAKSLDLPHPKAKGWEFTDLSILDLDAYGEAAGGDGASAEIAEPILPAPDGSAFLRQVDSLTLGSELPEPSGNGKPSEPTVMPLADAAARYPELVRGAPRLGRARRRHLRRAQRSLLGRRRVRLRPRRPALRDADRPLGHPGRRRLGDGLALTDRPRGGRRGRGLGAVPRGRPRGATRSSTGSPRSASAQGANLRFVCGQDLSDSVLGLRDPARRGRARRLARLARARLRLGARQGAHGDQARGPRLVGQGHRRLRRARHPAPRLRHDAGARRARHGLRPRLPRRPLRLAPPRSGAG